MFFFIEISLQIFFSDRFLSNYEYSEGSLVFADEIIKHSQAEKENRDSINSLSRNKMGSIIMDVWGGRVKFVKRGPRSNRQTAYVNLKKVEGNGKRIHSVLATDDISLPEGWMAECLRQGYYVFSRKEKQEFNAQRLTLELSVDLPPSSDPVYHISSHGCVTDLGTVLKINSSTAKSFPDHISCILQCLDKVPICLGFVLEKEDTVTTLSPYITGQLRDLSDSGKEPETRVFSTTCQIICSSGEQCKNCCRLKAVNKQRQKRISCRQSIAPNCNKRFLSREELVDQLKQEQLRRRNAEMREKYWREKFNSESLVVDDEDHTDLFSIFKVTKQEHIPEEMACLWEQQRKMLETTSKHGYRWHPK